MIIKLFQPPTKNWIIVAEELDDPATWDRFVPCQNADSERWKFDTAVKAATGTGLRLKACKELLARGVSAFEYEWDTNEDELLSHAIQVAETLGVELSMGAPSYTAA